MEKYREKKKGLYMVFIDLEKEYDGVPREISWWILYKKGSQVDVLNLFKAMYDGAITSGRTTEGETSELTITVGLHQGSALSLYLFALVMDELIRCI